MSKDRKRQLLLNINRILIYCFGLIGLFFDCKWCYVVSMTIWLWLPACIHCEQKILKFWYNKEDYNEH